VLFHRTSDVRGVRAATVVRVTPAAVGKEVGDDEQAEVDAPKHSRTETRFGWAEVPSGGRVERRSHVCKLGLSEKKQTNHMHDEPKRHKLNMHMYVLYEA
jgi:hypothetical protein